MSFITGPARGHKGEIPLAVGQTRRIGLLRTFLMSEDEGRRFPRLQSASPQGKLAEAITLLPNF